MALIVNSECAPGDADGDDAVGRAPLRGVVEKVRHRSLEGRALPDHPPGVGLDVEGDGGRTTAYPGDEEASAEVRRFTEGTLRDGKAAGAGTIIDTLEEAGLPPELDEEGLMIDVELEPAGAETWLRSFTDLRLALATRLGVEEGDEELWHALPDDDPRAQAHDIYEWVGYLQETLVLAMSD